MGQKSEDGKIFAPFTDDQIAALNTFQKLSDRYHPYTCPLEHKGRTGPVLLVAMTPGWRCSDVLCVYQQDWAYGQSVTIAKEEFQPRNVS